jgi:hypothetical protein
MAFGRLPIWPRVERYGFGSFDEVVDTAPILWMASEYGALPPGHVLYLVDFASQRRPDVDEAELIRLDNEAHLEAAGSEGFLLYFRGDVDADGYCRSFCVWRSKDEAARASQKPRHRAASEATKDLYATYVVTMRDVWLDESPAGFGVGLTRTYRSDDS